MSGVEIYAGITLLDVIIFSAIAAGTAYLAYSSVSDISTPSNLSASPELGLKENYTSTDFIIPVVYGTRRIGGNVVYLNTSGTDNKYLHMILVLAQGECDSILQVNGVDQVFLDDKLYTEYDEGNLVYYEFFNGSSTQNACATLTAVDGNWTDTLRDICYLYLRLEYDQKWFQKRPLVNVVLKGKKLYDPRDSSTIYNTNGVLALRDYLTNTRYGWGVPTLMLDDISLGQTATYFGTTKAWTFNRVYNEDSYAHDIAVDILKHFRGTFLWDANKIYTKYSDLNYEVSVMDLLDVPDPTVAGKGYDTVTGSVTRQNCRLSLVNGTAFAWLEGVDLSKYIDWQLVVTDSSGYQAKGYIKAAGTGETLGSQLAPTSCCTDSADDQDNTTGWTAGNAATLDSIAGGETGNCLEVTADGNTAPYAYMQALTLPTDSLFKFVFSVKQGTESTYRAYIWLESTIQVPVADDYEATGAWVSHTYYGTKTAAASTIVLLQSCPVINAGTTILFDNVSFKQVTEPPATGVTIVSSRDGAIYNWARIDSGFNYNDPSGYTYTLYPNIAIGAQIIDGSESISQPSRFTSVNRAVIKWVDASRDYTEDELNIVSEEDYDRAGDYRDLNIELRGCTDKTMALQLGTYYLEREILNRKIGLRCLDETMVLQPHDIVDVTTYVFDWTAHQCRVLSHAISSNDEVVLELMEEDISLYDDIVNIHVDTIYELNFPDPFAEPPGVTNVESSEELISYRGRRFTRLLITFDAPLNYVWYNHVEVWFSDDNATWKHLFNTTSDFNIDNVMEGQEYYVRLKVVNIWGVKQDDSNDYVVSRLIGGYTDAPKSLDALYAIVNENTVNLYAVRVDDADIELYEFRLGGWIGGVFLAAHRSPNLSLKGVKPGSHDFYCNTLSNNEAYGDTPRSASVNLPSPPIGWVLTSTETDDYGGGSHNNTEQVFYSGEYYLKCSHGVDWSSSSSSRISSVSSSSSSKSSSSSSSSSSKSSSSSSSSRSSSSSSSSRSSSSSSSSSSRSSSSSSSSSESSVSSRIPSSSSSSRSSSSSSKSSSSSSSSSKSSSSSSSSRSSSSSSSKSSSSSQSSSVSSSSSSTGPTDELVGIYTSPVFDISGDIPGWETDSILIFVEASIAVTGAGTTWADKLSDPTTWRQAKADTRSWTQIFGLSEAPMVSITLYHGFALSGSEIDSPSEVQKMEILSTVLSGSKYFQVQIRIEDPSLNVNALVENYALKFCSKA